MLSLYSLQMPPQFGNCTTSQKGQAAVVTLADFREIYKCSAVEQPNKLGQRRRYVTGFVSRKLASQTSCSECKDALAGQKGVLAVPEELVNCKTRGNLTHPSMYLFNLFREAEEQFSKHASDRDAYDKTIDAMLENFQFTFPCVRHKQAMLANLLHYYVCLRMRQ
ncbi:uncharacterized protein LOC135397438 [Ornithodoros turicata]|uniref:uncharacterized protein LOC135397438 n=1 Tax=Ornithodoros turicata TaxID=34597 RepID=UPI00313995DC